MTEPAGKKHIHVTFEIDIDRDPQEFLAALANDVCGEYKSLRVGDKLWLPSGYCFEIAESVVYRTDKRALMHDIDAWQRLNWR